MNPYSKMNKSNQKSPKTSKVSLSESEDFSSDEPSEDHDIQSTAAIEHLSYEELEDKLNEAEDNLNKALAEAEKLKAQVLHTHADLENIRKRAEKDIANAHKYGQERLINSLFPVLDSLERGLSIEIHDNEFAQSLHEGLAMTLDLFVAALEKASVKVINPLHQPFNPELHQAISTRKDENFPENTVIEVLQKGYQLHDRLVRPALVIVSVAA